jgi:hypothetical protein
VAGNVAWVAAESAPKHIRLTLVDSGYINPGDKTAVITFHTVTPVAVTDILTSERFTVDSGKVARVRVPCGLFRFIDVQFQKSANDTEPSISATKKRPSLGRENT